jgi:hypothetical protein
MKTWKTMVILIIITALPFTTCDTDGNSNGTIAHTHSWGEWTQTTPPTCTQPGIKTRYCTINPSHIDTQTQTGDPALGHDFELLSGIVSTCTTHGNGHKICNRCDHEESGDLLPLDQNAHDWSSWITKTPANCTEAEVQERTCSHNTEHKETQNVGIPLGHETEINAVPATCTSVGNTGIGTCTRCLETMTGEVIPALGHGNMVDNGVQTAATCVATGTMNTKCERNCGHTGIRQIPINPASHGNMIDTILQTAATCVAMGTMNTKCERNCGHTGIRQISINPASHGNMIDTIVQTAATCVATGTMNTKCERNCGYTGTRIISINNNAHVLGTWTTVTNPITSLSSVIEGRRTCQRLDCEHFEIRSGTTLSNYLSSLPVNTVDTPYTLVVSVSFLFGESFINGSLGNILRANANKYVSLDLSGSVFLSGGIHESAFFQCTSLVSIILPDHITRIESAAFDGCINLVSVTMGNNITVIGGGNGAFSNCTSLTSITIPDSVTSIGDNAFWGCTNLSSVTIGNSVTSIGRYAFGDCSFTSITIPDSVTSIGDGAFAYCSSLVRVTIPSNVTYIGGSAFLGCTKLTEINVDTGNANYSSETGVLYNKNKTSLIIYPAGKTNTSFIIPNSVTSIGDWAFWGCTNLSSVTIGNSVTSIGDGGFGYCSSLTSITIPDSVTSIGDSAFAYCSSLTSITIPDSVTSIGDWAFYHCTSLVNVIIGNGVASIGLRAFSNCTTLTSVTFAQGSRISNFGDNVFPEGPIGQFGNTLRTAYQALFRPLLVETTFTRAYGGNTWTRSN